MNDDADLTAFQLADSFLPVGSYSSSYALEQFVADGYVEDASALTALLETYLRRQVGQAELVALRAAHRAARAGDLEELLAVDHRLHAITMPAEFRESTTRAGARLSDLWRETHDVPLLEAYESQDTPGHYPVVLGIVTASEELTERKACHVHCHAFCTDMLGVAQRLCSLGHTDAQGVLVALQPVIEEVVDASADQSLESMTPFTPLIDIAAARHERAERRLFVS